MSMPGAPVDVNVSLFHWPFRHVGVETPQALLAQLDRLGVERAWTGSLEGVFDRDTAGVNARLAAACRQAPDRLLAFGTINPTLPDWQDDLRRCHETHEMPGVRLHPSYHGYDLRGDEVEELFAEAARRGRIVQLVVTMDDERTQHPVFRVPHVDLALARPTPAGAFHTAGDRAQRISQSAARRCRRPRRRRPGVVRRRHARRRQPRGGVGRARRTRACGIWLALAPVLPAGRRAEVAGQHVGRIGSEANMPAKCG